MALYDDLKSKLAFRDDPNWPTFDAAERVLVVSMQVSGAILAAYRKLRGDAAAQAELSAAIQRLYAEEVAPLDLPGIGPWAESLVDAQLGVVLGGLVGPADAALDRVLPNPVD